VTSSRRGSDFLAIQWICNADSQHSSPERYHNQTDVTTDIWIRKADRDSVSLASSPSGHRVLNPTRNAAGFEKNLASEFANEKRTAVLRTAAIARSNLISIGERGSAMIDAAEKYEAGRAAAIEREAAYEVEKLAYEASELEPRTMAGAIIQARVPTAYAEVEVVVGHYRGRSGQLVGLALAQSIAREVVPVVKKECACIVEMATHPNRRVQGSRQPLTRFDRSDEASPKGQRRIQPHIRQQHVT
jgi:hypothetical protein